MINRPEYLNTLISWREKQLIKVITGVRRCGKSTLFALYINQLKNSGVLDNQIISINLEDIASEELLNYKVLYEHISKRLCKDRFTYIFIDEIQQCKGFEKAVDSLFIKQNCDVYITGSNANMLSGELATLLSGRYVEIKMLPLSFAEYLSAVNKDAKVAFADYMRFGSFPYIINLDNNEEQVRQYLDGIFNTILVKDIANRTDNSDISTIEHIVKFLCSNVGNPVSAKKITDTLNSMGRKISGNTVENYLRALCSSFIFYKVNRFDVKGKAYLKTLGKYYLVDSGIRNMLMAKHEPDIGHILENIVYFELLRRGNKVSIGKVGESEVDFVTQKGDDIVYYQVSASLIDEKTMMREITPLKAINDNYPKFILTLDDYLSGKNYDGIKILNVIDWMIGK